MKLIVSWLYKLGYYHPDLCEAKIVLEKEWNRVKEIKNWKRTVSFDKIIDTDENFDFDD